jgi:hypothetical protein
VLTDAERDVAVDDVVFAAGGIGNDALYNAFRERARAAAPEAAVHVIGDAFAPRHLRHAIAQGATLGRSV